MKAKKIKLRPFYSEVYFPRMYGRFNLLGDGGIIAVHKKQRIYRDEIITILWIKPAIKPTAKFLKQFKKMPDFSFEMCMRHLQLNSAFSHPVAELTGLVHALDFAGMPDDKQGIKKMWRNLIDRTYAIGVFINYANKRGCALFSSIVGEWIAIKEKAFTYQDELSEIALQ